MNGSLFLDDYMEMVLAVRVTGARAILNMKKGDYRAQCLHPNYMISLKNKHYTGYKIHSRNCPKGSAQEPAFRSSKHSNTKDVLTAHMRGGYVRGSHDLMDMGQELKLVGCQDTSFGKDCCVSTWGSGEETYVKPHDAQYMVAMNPQLQNVEHQHALWTSMA